MDPRIQALLRTYRYLKQIGVTPMIARAARVVAPRMAPVAAAAGVQVRESIVSIHQSKSGRLVLVLFLSPCFFVSFFRCDVFPLWLVCFFALCAASTTHKAVRFVPTAVSLIALPVAVVLGAVGLGVEKALRAPAKPEVAVPVWEQRAQRQTAADAAAASGQTSTATTTATTMPQTESNRRTRISS